MIRLALMSVAGTAVIPMQDLLGLGEKARMNLPAGKGSYWRWRLHAGPDRPAPRAVAAGDDGNLWKGAGSRVEGRIHLFFVL